MGKKTVEQENEAAYAGRWVARLEGRIIAHGGTPEQARLAAQKSRYKERTEISYIGPIPGFSLSPLVERTGSILPDHEIFLVGGAVRDALLGHISHDLDFVVPENAIAAARKVANALNADFYVLDEAFDTARVLVRAEAVGATSEVGDRLDFSSYRGAKPLPAGSNELEADLRGRDLTINAIAYAVRAGAILDPLNGAGDLRAKMLRACSPTAMRDDPIRIVRTVRLAAALDFKIEDATREAMKAAAGGLGKISPERQRDELFKVLEGKRQDAALRALEMLGAFPPMLPELSAMKGVPQSAPHVLDVWEHTLSVVQHLDAILGALATEFDESKNNDLLTGLMNLKLGRYRDRFREHFRNWLNPERSMRALLMFAALYHDAGKPESKTVDATGRIRFLGHEAAGVQIAGERGRTFNLSRDEIGRVQTIIANHMRFHFHVSRLAGENKEPSRKAIYRFFRDTGEAGIDLVLLGLADLRGTQGHTLKEQTWSQALDVSRILLENYWEKPEESVTPPRLLDGNQLMHTLGMKSGPELGELLATIREAQASGEISTREQALEFARQWLTKGT